VPYASSAAAAAAASEGGALVTTTTSSAPTSSPPGGILPSLDGSIGGIPTKYLLYGALALVAFRMVK